MEEAPLVGRPTNVPSKDEFFAILIGINTYPKYKNLTGPVGDADRVRHWLVSSHGVPNRNIVILRDEQATGSGIRKALSGLVDNENIRPHAIVLVYYAGHGSTVPAPPSWEMPNNVVQMILPFDFDPKLSSNAKGTWKLPGHGILDVEFGHIIEDISLKKGGLRILVVMDSCYSGSGTRGGLTVRGGELYGYKIPEDALSFASKGRSFFTSDRSHILLAASAPNEKAHEDENGGLFTNALLAILKKPNLEDLTYPGLMTQLKTFPFLMEKQTPRCEGFNLDRTVFTLETRRSEPAVYTIQVVDEAPTTFRLPAGQRHGITNGAQFAVHTDKRCTSEFQVAYAVAEDTQPSVTTCSFLTGASEALRLLGQGAVLYAVQTLHGHPLRLFIDQNDTHYPRWKTLIDDHVNDINIRSIQLVRPGEEADLAISSDGKKVLFEVKNLTCLEYGSPYLSCRDVRVDDPDDYLLDILRGAGNFFRHLDLPKMGALPNETFEVRCLEVCRQRILTPWLPKPDALNLCSDHKIYLVENKGASYGFEIKNKSLDSLHAVVVLFNLHNLQMMRYDLSVNEAISPSQGVKGSLPAGQSLRIGFGDSGTPPRKFSLPEGQTRDVSFLKVFLSTTPHEFSNCDQEPFKKKEPAVTRGDDGANNAVEDAFVSFVIPIIQGDLPWLMSIGMPNPLA